MKFLKRKDVRAALLIIAVGLIVVAKHDKSVRQARDSRLSDYVINPGTQQLDFYWKDGSGKNYADFTTLRDSLESQGKELVFAVNGGMYNKERGPQGLYIEKGVTLAEIDTDEGGGGNFYLRPNGVFYLTESGKASIKTTDDFKASKNIKYATQSGPMLLIRGKVHPKFTRGSENLNIRNGVGILPDGKILFSIANEPINFYDFALHFKNHGCKNALYLDGFVSQTYLPLQKRMQPGHDFGVIIAESIAGGK